MPSRVIVPIPVDSAGVIQIDDRTPLKRFNRIDDPLHVVVRRGLPKLNGKAHYICDEQKDDTGIRRDDPSFSPAQKIHIGYPFVSSWLYKSTSSSNIARCLNDVKFISSHMANFREFCRNERYSAVIYVILLSIRGQGGAFPSLQANSPSGWAFPSAKSAITTVWGWVRRNAVRKTTIGILSRMTRWNTAMR